MRYRFGAQKLNLRRLQPERQRQRIYEFNCIIFLNHLKLRAKATDPDSQIDTKRLFIFRHRQKTSVTTFEQLV